ncbi:hypothetical protein D1871_03810 [Nakamurella silvestris]|nr:hypothetical protein D1871_03810 [Nakamurella silvestris]
MSGKKSNRIDPTWPQLPDGAHPITELNSETQGAPSPFGDVTFPVDAEELPYIHPTTVINR